MEILQIFLHLDKFLFDVIGQYGTITYFILFLIIFMETGFVVTPFLPGDSLLFAAGTLSAIGALNIVTLYVLVLIAAIGGDTANYWIGHFFGKRMKFVKKEHMEKTENFYKKYGNATIVIARFVPIVRTFAPFVAGIAQMNYRHFITYNILGGFLWVTLFVWGGYFFGNLPFVKENFEYVVLAIVFLSIVPIIIEWLKANFSRSSKKE